MRSCFLGLRGGGKEEYFWGPLRAQALEEELPDRSCSRRGTDQNRGAEQEQAEEKYPQSRSFPSLWSPALAFHWLNPIGHQSPVPLVDSAICKCQSPGDPGGQRSIGNGSALMHKWRRAGNLHLTSEFWPFLKKSHPILESFLMYPGSVQGSKSFISLGHTRLYIPLSFSFTKTVVFKTFFCLNTHEWQNTVSVHIKTHQ